MNSLFHHPVFGRSGDPTQAPRATVPLSMIDVVFLLLTFLLLGQFPLAEGLLSMPLASDKPAEVAAGQTLWVQVTHREGQIGYRLNDWPASSSSADLVGHIRGFVRSEGAAKLTVIISAEQGVPFERLVELWEACRDMGIANLALPVASPPPPQTQPEE